ncbi:MAG: ABC transporter ATP-binding protein [Betaproteobacteria bacterium]
MRAGGSHFLKVEGLAKRFGGLQALGGVDISLAPGEFRAIIGPNGAGKSTLFNVMTGMLRADAGRVTFDGQDVTGRPPHLLARMGIGRTFQITSVFHDLTALENVQVALLSHARRTWSVWPRAGMLHSERGRELLDLVGLSGSAGRLASALAHGDQKRLELAIALAGEPKLLLLDEPTAGMAAQERLESIRLVHRLASQLGLSCLFTEHDMAVVFAVATRITVLHQGKVLAEGTPAEVRARPEVQQVYLGEQVRAAA